LATLAGGAAVVGRRKARIGRRSGALFSYVDIEDRMPRRHPFGSIRTIVDGTLDALSGDFGRLL
jgi:hypothetical protein